MVEIKELVVRAIIANPPPSAGGGESCAPANRSNGTMAASGGSGASTDVVEDCVRQVLAILERQKQR